LRANAKLQNISAQRWLNGNGSFVGGAGVATGFTPCMKYA